MKKLIVLIGILIMSTSAFAQESMADNYVDRDWFTFWVIFFLVVIAGIVYYFGYYLPRQRANGGGTEGGYRQHGHERYGMNNVNVHYGDNPGAFTEQPQNNSQQPTIHNTYNISGHTYNRS